MQPFAKKGQGEKKLWNTVASQEMVVMIGQWQKKFKNNNSGNWQFRWIWCQFPVKLGWGYTNWPELLLLFFFYRWPTIKAISWPPPVFPNFFTLAILHRAAHFLQIDCYRADIYTCAVDSWHATGCYTPSCVVNTL